MSKYPGVKRLPSGKILIGGQHLQDSTNQRDQRPGKKGMVLAKEGDRIKLIHYGDSSMGHNYSAEARKSFKARHAKNIAKGKMSAAYWANKELWAGPSGSKKSPPRSHNDIQRDSNVDDYFS